MVKDVRFDFEVASVNFYVDVPTGSDLLAVQDFVERARPAGLHWGVRPWAPGPTWPEIFDDFSELELELLEGADVRVGGIDALLVQMCPWIRNVHVEDGPGALRVTIAPPGGHVADELLERVRRIVVAATGSWLSCDVVVGEVKPRRRERNPNPRLDALLDAITIQTSREGISDPELLRLHCEDEDYYRDVRESGFRNVVRRPPDEISLMLPAGCDGTDFRPMLLLYERIYIPAQAYTEHESRFGIPRRDMLELVGSGKCVPVLTERVGWYSQKPLRELIEAARDIVTPRQLGSRVASQTLDANPLWRIPRSEIALVRELLGDLRLALESPPKSTRHGLLKVLRVLAGWQADGWAGFMQSATNQGTRLPLRYGPGSFAAQLLSALTDRNGDDFIDSHLVGQDVAFAGALGAACVPRVDTSKELYAVIGSIAGNRSISRFEELEVLFRLDDIVTGLDLRSPTLSTVEWLRLIDSESPKAIRDDLAVALGIRDSGCEDLGSAIDRLRRGLVDLELAEQRTRGVVDSFDVIGLGTEVVAAPLGVPFLSWALGLLVKHSAPWLWEKLVCGSAARSVTARLQSLGHSTPVEVVRIHQLRRRIGK